MHRLSYIEISGDLDCTIDWNGERSIGLVSGLIRAGYEQFMLGVVSVISVGYSIVVDGDVALHRGVISFDGSRCHESDLGHLSRFNLHI